ncbi:MAG: hypothetical protein AAF328_05065 [Planctomycetota bacterium]
MAPRRFLIAYTAVAYAASLEVSNVFKMETRVLQTVRHARRVPARPYSVLRPLLATLLTLVVTTSAVPSIAQNADGLPQAILEKNGAWSAAEARTVESFIATNLEPFAEETSDAEQVAEARDALLEPLNDLRAEAAFQSQYFRALAASLRNGQAGFAKIGRINAMMLGSRVVDAAIVPLLETGITDEAPGVRYAAARSMLVVLTNEALGLRDNEKNRLITKLGDAAGNEANGYVAGKLIEAIRATNVDAQVQILLDVFNSRVSLHAADPALTYQPELTAMQELFIEGLGRPGGFGRDAARSFIQSAARYIRLTTNQLADDTVPEANQQAAVNLARQSYTVLSELAANAGQPGQRPADPVRFLPNNAARAATLANEWPAFLAPGPLNLTEDELSIADPNAPDPEPEPSEAPAAGE